MGFGGNGARARQIPSGMMRVEIASAVERIAAGASEHGLIENSDFISLGSNLRDDPGRSHCRTIYRLNNRLFVGNLRTTAASDHIIAGVLMVRSHGS